MKEYLDKNINYMQGLYDKNNLSDSGKIELNLLKEVKKQFDLHVVGCSKKISDVVLSALYNQDDFEIRRYPDDSISSINEEEVKRFVKNRY